MITISALCKRFDGPGGKSVEVLRDIDLDVPNRTIMAVVGPSGAGKTTLSKCISLLEKPTSGSVLVNGKNLSDLTGIDLRRERRAIGTIFQSSALLRRKTVAGNVALPLDYLGVVREDVDRRVRELLDQVGIGDKADRYPGELSGGQRQRVGIARALALNPQVLLSDESTSGLDPEATESILSLLKKLRDELGLSIILITHEMDVVRTVADQVAVLRAGSIVESGSVRELIGNPESQIGRQLLPVRAARASERDALLFEVTYGTQRTVPLDWVSLLTEKFRARVGLLGGVVENIGGASTGRLFISVALEAGFQHQAQDISSWLNSLGLLARTVSDAHSIQLAVAEAA